MTGIPASTASIVLRMPACETNALTFSCSGIFEEKRNLNVLCVGQCF